MQQQENYPQVLSFQQHFGTEYLFSFQVLRDGDVLSIKAVNADPACVVESRRSSDVKDSGGRVGRLYVITFNQITTQHTINTVPAPPQHRSPAVGFLPLPKLPL